MKGGASLGSHVGPALVQAYRTSSLTENDQKVLYTTIVHKLDRRHYGHFRENILVLSDAALHVFSYPKVGPAGVVTVAPWWRGDGRIIAGAQDSCQVPPPALGHPIHRHESSLRWYREAPVVCFGKRAGWLLA
jgi:hypothetical protein